MHCTVVLASYVQQHTTVHEPPPQWTIDPSVMHQPAEILIIVYKESVHVIMFSQ